MESEMSYPDNLPTAKKVQATCHRLAREIRNRILYRHTLGR